MREYKIYSNRLLKEADVNAINMALTISDDLDINVLDISINIYNDDIKAIFQMFDTLIYECIINPQREREERVALIEATKRHLTFLITCSRGPTAKWFKEKLDKIVSL